MIVESDGDKYLRDADGNSLMCDMNYYPWTPNSESDWQLIAAAPDLLAALEAAANEMDVAAGQAWGKADYLESCAGSPKASADLRNSAEKLKACANEARAAIAKAKGVTV